MMNGTENDQALQEVQGIWKEMWGGFLEGAKKMVRKVAEHFDREQPEQPQAE
jgi:hypothetical protein